MRASLDEAWPRIRRMGRSTMPFVFATTNADGSPQVTPIGSVWLEKDGPRGYYLEKFPTRLRQNLDRDPRFSLLMIDRSPRLWLGGLWRGRFAKPIGVRLIGRSVGRRPASAEELARFQRKVRLFRGTRGYQHLWAHMPLARDLVFEGYAPIALGEMTAHEWQAEAGGAVPAPA